jgi:hypothetical protein
MTAATCKADLLSATQTEFTALTSLLDTVARSAQTTPDPDAEGTPPKDIVAHRAHWIELFLGWYADGQAGKHPAIPAPGYKWNMLKVYNADLRVTQRDMTWGEARQLLSGNHRKLVELIGALDDHQLYAAPMKGGNSKWPTGRWAEAAGASHYRSARKYLHRRLNQLKPT